jgi:hypothetical protein
LVFWGKNRDALIRKEWKGELEKYILTQEERHKTKPFKVEYLEMLVKNNVEFKEEYLIEFFSDFDNWVKYYGALHLGVGLKMHCYKYYAALPLSIR